MIRIWTLLNEPLLKCNIIWNIYIFSPMNGGLTYIIFRALIYHWTKKKLRNEVKYQDTLRASLNLWGVSQGVSHRYKDNLFFPVWTNNSEMWGGEYLKSFLVQSKEAVLSTLWIQLKPHIQRPALYFSFVPTNRCSTAA